MVLISVVVPTYNRCEKIKDTLRCLLEQSGEQGLDFEFIVVDNNSTDATKAVVQEFMADAGGRLNYVFEPRQGRTFALNTGIAASQGSIITCVDDDCLLERDHLLKISRIFAAHPDVGFIGGKIYPHWLDGTYPKWLEEFLPNQPLRSQNPEWFNEFFCGPLGILDYGPESFVIDYSRPNYDQRHFYGANISFRKKLFEQYGYFDEKSILVEDTEMCIRLLMAGVKGMYTPDLVVYHKIRASNVSENYYFNWYYTKGKRREIVERYRVKFYHPFGVQIAFIKKTVELYVRSFFAKTFKEKLHMKCQALFNCGQMIKIVKASRGRLFGAYPKDITEPVQPRLVAPLTTPIQEQKTLISVIVCTKDRANSLKDVLNGLLDQIDEHVFDYEVLVVDNNSVDGTKAVTDSFMPRFNGRLRYYFEPRQGKPFALNLGIREARGNIIVSTDDDCILENDYLRNNFNTFKDHGPDVGFIGGKILPYWVGEHVPSWVNEILSLPSVTPDGRPNWFKMSFEGPLGILDYGDHPFMIENDEKRGRRLFYGANMAFKKEVFERFGDFRQDKTITQDTEICVRLLNAGIKGLYQPAIRVFHKINTSKISPQYYYRWYYLRGQFLEQDESYARKFYHPLGIQYSLILQTLGLVQSSLFEKSYGRKVYLRCQMAFNMGRMKKTAIKNLV